MISFLRVVLVVAIALFSLFLTKLYEARSFVRRLQRQGYVSAKPANSISDYR